MATAGWVTPHESLRGDHFQNDATDIAGSGSRRTATEAAPRRLRSF